MYLNAGQQQQTMATMTTTTALMTTMAIVSGCAPPNRSLLTMNDANQLDESPFLSFLSTIFMLNACTEYSPFRSINHRPSSDHYSMWIRLVRSFLFFVLIVRRASVTHSVFFFLLPESIRNDTFLFQLRSPRTSSWAHVGCNHFVRFQFDSTATERPRSHRNDGRLN